jgi:hypothetical protein
VAEELNTKAFVEQSMYKESAAEVPANGGDAAPELDGEHPNKRRKIVQFEE